MCFENGCRKSSLPTPETLPDINGIESEVCHGGQREYAGGAGNDEVPFDELFGSANIVVDGVQFFAAQIFGPHIGDVDVADQFVEGEAKIIAEKDQALEVRVRLPGFPNLKR